MIERQLEKRDLRDYDIYIGFMKGRIGTPTPTAASGTIEELDDARSRFGKRRLPSEILFYFIGEPAGDVLEFKRRLERESFIYASARDTDEFERLVTQHLGDIVAHWRQLGKKIARARRFIQPVDGGFNLFHRKCPITIGVQLHQGAQKVSLLFAQGPHCGCLSGQFHLSRVDQSVAMRPGTRSNSFLLSVTSTAPRRRACAASKMS